MGHNQTIGQAGEAIAAGFLQHKGFTILERNYWKPWGEIDIIATIKGTVHFVEVKTVSLHKAHKIPQITSDVSHDTAIQPEENMHEKKIKRLHRVIQSYLTERDGTNEWQLDLVTVKLNEETKEARCRLEENVL